MRLVSTCASLSLYVLLLAHCSGSGTPPTKDGSAGGDAVGGDGQLGVDGAVVYFDSAGPTPDSSTTGDSGSPAGDGGPKGDAAQCTPTTPSTEVHDNKDNNCNGQIDEGFWVVVHPGIALSELTAEAANCSDISKIQNATCIAGSRRYCVNKKNFIAGWGPIEVDGPNSKVNLFCLADAKAYQVPEADLTAKNSNCEVGTMNSMPCRSAVRKYCQDAKFAGGVGPLEFGTTVHFACTKHGAPVTTTWAELTGILAGCTQPDALSVACRAAASRLCKSKGHASGFGPLLKGGTTDIEVFCLNDKPAQ